MIWDGKIFRGKDNLAGEIGHIPVSDAGVPCSCGSKGCLETFCSGVAIAQRARDWGQRRPERVARMVELSGGAVEDITAEAVLLAADEGDPAAVHIVREVARWLARGLLTVVRVVNPDKIILGGGVAQAGSVLLGPVYGYLEEFSSPTIRCSTQIVVAELETYSPLRGAAAMAINLIEQAPPCTS
jgi:glucokinase